ncbi:MAG: Hpt domain-containing protein [Defluviitaleaceae bacterium]|nr:Hpt domain-containing protein [Defluviitaleaceae bacterium]
MDQKVISIEEGLKRVRNNKVLYLRLLNNFNGHTLLNDIVQATENNDLDEVANAVHTLKGVSSNLAMNLLADVLEQMEVKLKAGENIESFIPILEENLKEIEESIKSFAAEVE